MPMTISVDLGDLAQAEDDEQDRQDRPAAGSSHSTATKAASDGPGHRGSGRSRCPSTSPIAAAMAEAGREPQQAGGGVDPEQIVAAALVGLERHGAHGVDEVREGQGSSLSSGLTASRAAERRGRPGSAARTAAPRGQLPLAARPPVDQASHGASLGARARRRPRASCTSSSKRSLTLPASPSVLPPGKAMPTASMSPPMQQPLPSENVRTLSMVSTSFGLVAKLDGLGWRRRTSGSPRAGRRSRRGRCPRPRPWRSARRSPASSLPRMIAMRLVPGADQRLAEVRVGRQRLGVDHHQVDDLARDLRAVEQLGGARERPRPRRAAGSR